jgi:hypothetical protein
MARAVTGEKTWGNNLENNPGSNAHGTKPAMVPLAFQNLLPPKRRIDNSLLPRHWSHKDQTFPEAQSPHFNAKD